MQHTYSILEWLDNGSKSSFESGLTSDAILRATELTSRGLRIIKPDTQNSGLAAMHEMVEALQVLMKERDVLVADSCRKFLITEGVARFDLMERLSQGSVERGTGNVRFTVVNQLSRQFQEWADRGSDDGSVLIQSTLDRVALATLERQLIESVAGPRADLPEDSADAAAFRFELAHGWLDAEAVSDLLGSRAENKSQLPNRLRKAGRILGVWLVQDRCFRFPPWQFRKDQVIPEFPQILAVVRKGVAGGAQTSGWEEVDWFVGPHARLNGKRPSEILPTAPDRVLALAEREFSEGSDARW